VDRIARAMHALFDAPEAGAAVGFAMYDEQLRYVAVSESVAAVHGHPAEESVGRTVREVMPDIADELEPILHQVLETGEPRLEVEVGAAGRGDRVWLGNYYPLRDGGAAVLGAIVVEITDRKRAEHALREAGERLARAQRLARMGAWTLHVDDERAEWSEELFEIYGVAGPEAPGLDRWLPMVVPDDRDALSAAMAQAIEKGAPFDRHFRFRRPSGVLVHIRTAGTAVRDASGRVVALKGFAQDVTELRRALDQQRAVAQLGQAALSRVDLDALFDEAVAVVAEVMLVEQAILTERLPDGRFLVRAGRGWREGAIGDIVAPTGQSGYTYETGGPVLVADWNREQRFEYTRILRDVGVRSGASVPIGRFGVLGVESVHVHHFGQDDVTFLQSVANVLAAAIDARGAAERISELAGARQRLVAQALDAEERTRRGIAEALHDGALQEALVLRHSVGRLLGGGLGGQEDAERVRGAIERMADQLREAMVALHPTVLQAGGLAPALTAVAEQQARIGGFSADVDVDPAAVGVRDQLVLSIARELLVNAAKHARARHVRVQVRRAGDTVELEVADDGAGIAEERLRAAVAEGHIGLASSAERVAAVGGRLEIGGGPGHGTVATARLPAPPAAAA
jgi:PAS domain S-box-containing protein